MGQVGMTKASAQPVAIKREAGAGDVRWWLGVLATIKLSGADTGGHHALIEMVTPTGLGAPPHVHRREEETFYVIDGELSFTVDGQAVIVGPGEVLHIPRDVPHAFTVTTPHPARYLTVFSPAFFDGFIKASSEPAQGPGMPPVLEPTSADIERINTLMVEFGTESLAEEKAIVS